jgi:hypothetical protein
LTVAAQLSDRLAPEHLELCVADPDALAAQITHAGAIFWGRGRLRRLVTTSVVPTMCYQRPVRRGLARACP